MMKFGSVALLIALLNACGGGSSSATYYGFATTPINSQRIYSKAIIDNSNNAINLTVSDTTTAVNPDGSWVELENDPTNSSVTVDGTTYSITTESTTRNNSGQALFLTYTPSGGSLTTCTFAPHGGGPDYPLVAGKTWSITYTETCGASAPISYSQTGSVIDIETVTVPAGTYSTAKLQSTYIWTDKNGTTHTETLTNWRDPITGISVKSDAFFTYSGTALANGYPVTNSVVLQSGAL